MFSLSSLFGGLRKKRSEGKRRAVSRKATLRLEALEDRVVPVGDLNAFNQNLAQVLMKHAWTPQQQIAYFNNFVQVQHFSPDLARYVIQYHENLVREQVHSVLTPGPVSASALSSILPTGKTGMTTAPGAQPFNQTTGWNDAAEQVVVTQALQIAQQRGVDAAVKYVDYWTSADSRQHFLYDFGYARLANLTGSAHDGYLISHDPTVLLMTDQWITDAVNTYSQRFLPYLGMTGNYGAVGASVGLDPGGVANLHNASLTGQGNGGGTMTLQSPYASTFGLTPATTLGTGTSIGGILSLFNGGARLPGTYP